MTDLMDRMDERLSAAARRWQAEQPPPPAVPLERFGKPVARPRHWRLVLAAAVAIVVVGGGAFVVAGLGDGGSNSAPPTGQRTVQVHRQPRPAVPWAHLKAGHPDVRHRVHGHVVTPYDHVAATGHISGHARPGDTLVFVAVLESPTDLPLDPCPDFNIAFGRGSWHTWQLNCNQVPYRDGQGRPLLPAFKNVRFEMRVTVPDEPGRQKVLWTLDGPQQMPGFYGIVTVTAG